MAFVALHSTHRKKACKLSRSCLKPGQNLKLWSKVFQAINLNPVIFFVIRVSRKFSHPSSPPHRILKLQKIWSQVSPNKTMEICLPLIRKTNTEMLVHFFFQNLMMVNLFRILFPFQGEFSCISVHTNNVLSQ